MALTLNNFTGFETGGLEEAAATAGTPDATEATIVRTGLRSLAMGTDTDDEEFDLGIADVGVADAGDGHIYGMAFYSTDVTPSGGDVMIFSNVLDKIAVWLESDGDIRVEDAVGTTLFTATTPLSTSTWHYIELYLSGFAASGITVTLFVDDTQIGTSATANTTVNRAGRLYIGGVGQANKDAATYYDDIYILTGATAATDRLGDFNVKSYQSTDVGDTDQGDALADGTWALVSETPGNSGTANDAQYVDTGNLTGSTITDGGDRSGPSGDSDVTGTIKGAKYIATLSRGTGPGREHKILYGNNVDGVTATADLVLTASYVLYEVLSVAAGVVPLSTEYFQQGFSKSATGGTDLFCGDQWAMLGYVPSGGATARTKTLSADSLLQKQNILKTLSADALLAKLGIEKTLSADALLVKTILLTLSADSLLQKNVSLTVLADALLAKLGITKTLSADALLVKTIETAISADALLQKGIATTLSADALLRKLGVTATALVDALLQKQGITATTSADALLVKNILITLSADALLSKAGVTKTLSADALLRLLGIEKTTSADALLQKLGITKTTSADALLQKTAALTVSADALLRALDVTKTTSADALLRKLAITQTVSADALLQKLVELTLVTDALLLKQGVLVTTSADSILTQIASGTITTSADALLQILVSLTASADALLQLQGIEVTVSADSLLQKTITTTTSADALLAARQVLTFSTDALLLKQNITLTTSANAILNAAIAAAFRRHRGFTQNVGKMMG